MHIISIFLTPNFHIYGFLEWDQKSHQNPGYNILLRLLSRKQAYLLFFKAVFSRVLIHSWVLHSVNRSVHDTSGTRLEDRYDIYEPKYIKKKLKNNRLNSLLT